MSNLAEILKYNAQFVANKDYEPFRTDGFPDKRMVIVACMDTRLTELLPKAMNLRNGDVKIIKVAGAVVAHPFGSVMRSILIAVYALHADEVLVIGHHDCGMATLNREAIFAEARRRGIPDSTFQTLAHAGIQLDQWLTGFDRVEDAVARSVKVIKEHPLLPKDLIVHGLVIHPVTGKLDVVTDPN